MRALGQRAGRPRGSSLRKERSGTQPPGRIGGRPGQVQKNEPHDKWLVAGSSVVMKNRRLQAAAPWCSVGLFATGLLMSAALRLEWTFVLFELALVPMLFCVGMITPVGITLALNSVTEHRDIDSALLGALPFLLGGIAAPLTGLGDMIRSMTALVLLCSAVCLGLYLCSRRWDYSAPGN